MDHSRRGGWRTLDCLEGRKSVRQHGPDHLLKQVVVHLEVAVRVRVHQGRDAGNEAVVAITHTLNLNFFKNDPMRA